MGRTKQDKARISKQEHEIVYLRKIAREYLKETQNGVGCDIQRRLAKAVLKFTKGKCKE